MSSPIAEAHRQGALTDPTSIDSAGNTCRKQKSQRFIRWKVRRARR